MKQNIVLYLFVFFLITCSKSSLSQNFSLELTSKDEIEKAFFKKINYKKSYRDSTLVNVEIYSVFDYLKDFGFFTSTIDSIKKNKKETIAYFSLNKKVEIATINVLNNKVDFNFLKIKNNSFTIPIEKLQLSLKKIAAALENSGNSFSKVSLINIKLKNNVLFANLLIKKSTKRRIDKTIIKGYKNFPKPFIKHYFNIKNETVFKQKKIKAISDASKNLQFIEEIKPPEALFTKDSTFLYIYLRKKQNNSFDGLANFASKESGGILFNGHVDLKLNNVLNTGENFDLFWNSIGKERQEFRILTKTPYIFNTALTPEISFSIYKQDSTFLNTRFVSKLFYDTSSKTKIAVTYDSESSKSLIENASNNIKTFSNYFLGLLLQYKVSENSFFTKNKFYLEVNPTLGKREIDKGSSNQFKIETTLSYIWSLGYKSNIFIKNKIGYLNSDSFIDNELFRIGGANSIRGINEQSIFTNNYTYFNIEYRYLTSEKSFFYTITDLGSAKINLANKNFLGIGLGYLFTTNKSQINISTVIGKTPSQPFLFKNSKLIISWVNFF